MFNFTEEAIKIALQAKSLDELLVLAKESNIDITREEGQVYFNILNPKIGELADEELDNVSGGSCEGREKICKCGSNDIKIEYIESGNQSKQIIYTCRGCGNRWVI